jgi:hypothetical protein
MVVWTEGNTQPGLGNAGLGNAGLGNVNYDAHDLHAKGQTLVKFVQTLPRRAARPVSHLHLSKNVHLHLNTFTSGILTGR